MAGSDGCEGIFAVFHADGNETMLRVLFREAWGAGGQFEKEKIIIGMAVGTAAADNRLSFVCENIAHFASYDLRATASPTLSGGPFITMDSVTFCSVVKVNMGWLLLVGRLAGRDGDVRRFYEGDRNGDQVEQGFEFALARQEADAGQEVLETLKHDCPDIHRAS